ncbi:MAG: FAD:protein FMN transferase [Hyphomicrobiaceae bacterium]
MTSPNQERRRVLKIFGALPGMLMASSIPGVWSSKALAATNENLHVWRGVALGADATIKIHHPDGAVARGLIDRSLAEVARLEGIFSLYDPRSALSRLNRDGLLDAPPLELVELLGRSVEFTRMTGGAFDVTVQPLWKLYAEHFSRPDADPAGPAMGDVAAARACVGSQGIVVASNRIHLGRRGAAVTLNGIAQGYLTDRVVELLRSAGIGHTLVDMGEIRAMDGRPEGGPWRAGLRDPGSPGKIMHEISLDNRALATSAGSGTLLDPAGRFNHIFDPATGATSSRYSSVSVVADNATTADALSTAFSLMPATAIAPIANRLRLSVYLRLAGGALTILNPI